MSDFLTGWLKSESAEHDKISVKRAYIDINDGSLHDGVLFSQIMYWHGRSMETGKPRLTIKKDGHLWLAKRNEDWYAECRIDESTARKGIARMIKRGLLIKAVYHFGGVPTTHIRVNPVGFEAAIKVICPDVADKAETEPSLICPDVADGFDLSGQMVLTSEDSSYNTETPPKTTTEPPASNDTDARPVKRAPKKREPKSDTVPRDRMNPMLDALVLAFGYTETVWKTPKAGELRTAAKSLCLAEYEPMQVATVYAYCEKHFTYFGPNAIAKHAPDALKAPSSNGNGLNLSNVDKSRAEQDANESHLRKLKEQQERMEARHGHGG